MPDLRVPGGRRARSRLDLRKPSPTVSAPVERIGCDHVADGAPVAGFTTAKVALPGEIKRGEHREVFLDLCEKCLPLAQFGGARSADERRSEHRN